MAQGLYLSQRMSQQMVLAPQLQQSLALLQAPILELRAQVEQELQQNPVLEEVAAGEAEQDEKLSGEPGDANGTPDLAEPPADVSGDTTIEKNGEPAEDFQAEFERLSQQDQEWRDHYAQSNVRNRVSEEDEERRQFMFDSLVAGQSWQEFLLEQTRDAELSPEQVSVAEMIVGNIDDRGYLQSGVEELSLATNIPLARIEAVLAVVQTFHPPGVGARDLRECLLLQLERAGRQETLECRMVRDHMEALGRRKFPEIARALGEDVVDVQEAALRIGHLDPHPGRAFLPESQVYIVPEVFVQKTGDEFTVTLNNEQVPHLRISNQYKDLMAQANSTAEVREYIREKIRAGKFLIKSLHQRQHTIRNIAREIVHRQREFMEQGMAHLKPLTMVQVAEVVGVHETTVSRAVSGKYMETPQGVFEMKFFFSSGFRTAAGVDLASTSIKDMLADLVKSEDPHSPLSDETIVKQFGEKGINIARRTVAKYRAELDILPSNLRRAY